MAEVILRLTRPLPPFYSERNTIYHYDSELGWFPNPSLEGMCRYVHVHHNTMGFRDREIPPDAKNVLAVVGDSFVYGYDVKQEEVFTERLRHLLPRSTIVNLGVSGYGTDQEFLLLQKQLPRLNPKSVLLVFNSNDWQDNETNKRYGYYKPYFVSEAGSLRVQGIPVPKCLLYYPAAYPRLFKSALVVRTAELIWKKVAQRWPVVQVPNPTLPLLLTIRDYVQSHHARFILGFIDITTEEKKFCVQSEIQCVNLHSAHLSDTGHWDAKGHQEIAQTLSAIL